MPLDAGLRLGSYEIISPLGAGGMGEVYRARHVRLGRDVAIKVLPAKYASDPERLKRFEREARSASALNHPNIVTIYDIDEHEGTPYIAMELVEGKTLRRVLETGPMPIDRLLDAARQIADGLNRAHAAGIVHRDLKPENVMITEDGLVKILDFGLAKLLHPEDVTDSEAPTASALTRQGDLAGTLQYLAPEQLAGGPADRRTDQFSLGVVLYEMACGRRPFRGESTAAIVNAILNDHPPAPRSVRPDMPSALDHLIIRCLDKDPNRRFESTAEMRQELDRTAQSLASPLPAGKLALRRSSVVTALVVLGLIASLTAWWWIRSSSERWARLEALPKVTRLTEAGAIYDAYELALEAERYIPDDEALQRMLDRITLPGRVATEPPGALVEIKGYRSPDDPWTELGLTPLDVRLPYALMRWRISKAGYETFEGAPFGGDTLQMLGGLPLQREGERPPGMVWVPSGTVDHRDLPVASVGEYWLDRYEVTNEEYRAFVSADGYARREYWTQPFVEEGRELTWDEAMSRFHDTTGRPGPAGWELGAYPEGRERYPVGGLSWYEAAAYCAFVGKSLPTVYHWYNATHQDQLSDILSFSNFGPNGPVPVGSLAGLGDFGTYDMAGNVKEWTWNGTDGKRYILGGAWGEPSYQYSETDAQNPFERLPTHGVRCARYPEPVEPALSGSVAVTYKALERTPVSDDVFEAYRGLYRYDHTDLDARIDAVDDESPDWRREKISFAAAYGGERVIAILFLPKHAALPYQVVLYYPGDDALAMSSSDTLASEYLFDFIPRSGRAFVYPIYKGLYERRTSAADVKQAPAEWRDMMLYWYKDLARTLDYLETRQDIDSSRIAFYGFSTAFYGTIFTAVDDRFKASVMLSTGLVDDEMLPEMDPVNFAPRSRVPTLMINGRDDFVMPVETRQKPLFDLIGATEKRHVPLDGGHLPPDRHALIRAVLDWLDRYLGPVS